MPEVSMSSVTAVMEGLRPRSVMLAARGNERPDAIMCLCSPALSKLTTVHFSTKVLRSLALRDFLYYS